MPTIGKKNSGIPGGDQEMAMIVYKPIAKDLNAVTIISWHAATWISQLFSPCRLFSKGPHLSLQF